MRAAAPPAPSQGADGGVRAAARDAGAPGDVVRLAIAAMGTRFELALRGPDRRHARAVGELALEEIRLAHGRLSAFEPASLVSAINRRAGEGWTTVDPATFDLLALAPEVHRASGGALDITLGPLMRAWGFRGGGAPEAAAVERARAICGIRLLSLDAPSRRVALAAAGAQLDLGAIAKGHALDLAAAVLREHGVECALLHAGTSTALALGAPPGEEGWKIAMADRGRRLGPVVTLRDQALSVSSPSGRVIEAGGEVRGHVLDPRTGAPARVGRYAAAVFPADGGTAPSPIRVMIGGADQSIGPKPDATRATDGGAACARADAWSTALLVCAGRPAGAPAELTSLILPAADAGPGAERWRLAGPGARAFDLPGAGGDGRGSGPQEILA